jgi:hypothetical protein
MARGRIPEFESYDPSHAVVSSAVMTGVFQPRRGQPGESPLRLFGADLRLADPLLAILEFNFITVPRRSISGQFILSREKLEGRNTVSGSPIRGWRWRRYQTCRPWAISVPGYEASDRRQVLPSESAPSLRAHQNASALFESAFVQAERYGQGVLAGIELTGYRYLVLVSTKRVAIPGDRQAGPVRYRHVNIAVDPDTPSRESARAAAPGRGKSGGKKK